MSVLNTVASRADKTAQKENILLRPGHCDCESGLVYQSRYKSASRTCAKKVHKVAR